MKTLQKVFLGVLVSAFILTSSHAEKKLDIGVGYNGMYIGEFISGISARTWVKDDIGLEINVGDLGVKYGGDKADLLIGTGKFLYAPIVHSNSKFYIGVEVGGIKLSFNDASTGGYMVRPFFGSEYRFSEMKELGFTWDIGWTYSSFATDNDYTATICQDRILRNHIPTSCV